jgi:acyl transferase domain-containing protein
MDVQQRQLLECVYRALENCEYLLEKCFLWHVQQLTNVRDH